jgi:CubicO group peptidase (beta-lactamase class C family)
MFALPIAQGTPVITEPLPSQVANWVPDGAMDGGNVTGEAFPIRVVRRGETVRGLPIAARQITVTYDWLDRRWSLDDYMSAYNVSGVLVLRRGEVILERYGGGRSPTDRWCSESVAKSVTSLLAGAAIRDKKLRLKDQVTRYVPELRGSAYDGVTVRDILTMSSGVKWEQQEGYLDAGSDISNFYAAAETGDPVTDVLKVLSRADPPGSAFLYNTAETYLAGLVVSCAVGMPLADYLSEKIWKPCGMERDAVWHVDRQGRELAGCCLVMTLADFARLGQFALEDGVAGGNRILPEGWIQESTRRHISLDESDYGYLWWVGSDSYEASGIYGQSIRIYPRDQLVIVVNSKWPKPDDKDLRDALCAFQDSVHRAATARLRRRATQPRTLLPR